MKVEKGGIPLIEKIVEIEGMQVTPLTIHADTRGKFTRILDQEWFNLSTASPKQINLSQNPATGTLRGMHFQIDGQPEHKVITLISGSIFLVVIDLRKSSKTYLNKFSTYVKVDSANSYFIPSGCANGWITLSENTWVHYAMYSRFETNKYSGFKYDDPFFAIEWPCEPMVISDQDLHWPPYQSVHDI